MEALHKYGDEHPETGLKVKVKGWQFSQKIDVMDPVTRLMDRKPMKPFMVNQLTMAIERDQLILSPFDELLHKQLIDYEVIRIAQNGMPVYTDVNEHFVDALGLAFLAFALEFPDLTKTIESVDFTSEIIGVESSPLKNQAEKSFNKIARGFSAVNPWKNLKNGTITYEESKDPDEPDGPTLFPISASHFSRRKTSNWGSRMGGYGSRRTNF